MKLSRRSLFGKTAGAIVVAATAPLYIPSSHLDFGIPRRIETAYAEPASPEPMVKTWVLRPGPNGIPRFVPIELTVSAYKELAASELYAANAEQARHNAGSVHIQDYTLAIRHPVEEAWVGADAWTYRPGVIFDHGVEQVDERSIRLDPWEA